MSRYDIADYLVGKSVRAVRMDGDSLAFLFDDGTHQCFDAEGDCCSYSYFHDFIGVDKLVANGPILSVRELPMDVPDDDPDIADAECLQAYGVEFVTESPEWGEQTSVLSFRNDSNGYYGGEMVATDAPLPDLPDSTVNINIEGWLGKRRS